MYKKTLRVASTLFAVLILFSFSFPSLISTLWGKDLFLVIVNHIIPGSISIKEWHLTWLGNQEIKGFELRDNDNQVILVCENLKLQLSLFQIFQKNSIFAINIENLDGRISYEKSGITNIQKSIIPHRFNHAASSKISNKETFVELLHVSGQFFPLPDLTKIYLKGKIKDQEVVGHFEISAIFNQYGLSELNGKIIHFPVTFFDALLLHKNSKHQAAVTALFGNELNLSMNTKREKETSLINLQIVSPNIKWNLKGNLLNGKFTLAEPSKQEINLTPLLSLYSIEKQIQGDVIIQELSFTINHSNKSDRFNTTLNIESHLALENFAMNKIKFSADGSLGREGKATMSNLNFYGFFTNVAIPMHVFINSFEFQLLK